LRFVINENKTDGLDMDQTARYLVAIADLMRKQHRGAEPDKKIAGNVIQKCLPQASFIGCALLLDFIAERYQHEDGMPDDIDMQRLNQASLDFAALAAQTNSRVKLK
jgi:hypothetical protein